MPIDSVTRRRFLAATGAGAAALAAPSAMGATSVDAPQTNSALRIGFIGVGDDGRVRSGGSRGRCQAHIDTVTHLQKERGTVEAAYVCDVFNLYTDSSQSKIKEATGKEPKKTGDYRDILADPSIDAVVIATPDHWHARQTIDALEAGKHVYCEKPMTHSVQEAIDVYHAWKRSGKVMQVGVQSTSLPVWGKANEYITTGRLGKVLGYQTEYFRNSDLGQWRYYPLIKEMTPKNIDWNMFLGREFDLAPEQPFDRARFGQWRCYWDFGAGMFTDLFVHRTTSMLKATGLRFPGRVTGGGGIYLEYDGRDVPDVATVVADFEEGCQGLVTATMCSNKQPIKQFIRGHFGNLLFGNGEQFDGFDFVAERSPVTHDSSIQDHRVESGLIRNTTFAHFQNFVDAVGADDPAMVNCSPELGAAAMAVVKLGSMSYRTGKVYHFDSESMTYGEADSSWAERWEQRSKNRGDASHVAGWTGGDKGSKLLPPEYQSLEGAWVDGKDPAAGA
ncbi:Glucose--fructose oxidoreductase precursor [Pseudobythopirellula maris]|uniref:Glucose--fructose oxidoreductase n=1 Tax=Pseudobythopirellula maris TaxID=2527991 RepID=A0A5C5ZIC5_9BACT|nr:Gfo/Idh/MocA family oxidoreductase [Pseudobythopirellula maris]TWT86747.1 Glucose--fructose oxidoreductase precursor [Pseudobythopirellula maris]